MGKISTGCDIVFKFGNEEIARVGSELSFEQSSLAEVAKILMDDPTLKDKLYTKLKYEAHRKEVTTDDLKSGGIVANDVLSRVIKHYPSLDWEGIDQSIKLFTAEHLRYLNLDLSNSIITLFSKETNRKELIIVINPSDVSAVRRLNEFLRIKKEVRTNSARNFAILDNSELSLILDVLKEMTVEKALQNLAKVKSRKNVTEGKIWEAELLVKKMEKLRDAHIKDARDLVEFYLENESFFTGISYKSGDSHKTASAELRRVCKAFLGIDTSKAEYTDIFANEIIQSALYDRVRLCSKVSMPVFMTALATKLANLEENPTEENAALRNAIKDYQKQKAWNLAKLKHLVDLLIDDADDEFSYAFIDADLHNIYLKNVPRILKERFPDFTWKSIQLLKPQRPYKGFYIYLDPQGKYYYSKHPISEYTWGTRYASEDDCKKRIDARVDYEAIAQESLIAFKLRRNDAVFVPNKYIKGLVIRSLNIHFKPGTKLNSIEQSLIYDSLHLDNNTLSKFYDYVVGIVRTGHPDRVREILQRSIDTAEKAACFIYALTELEGQDRYPISSAAFDKVIARINEASKDYEYFVVDEVQELKKTPSYGFIPYRKINRDDTATRTTYKVILTKIDHSLIHNGKADYDNNGTPVAVGTLLTKLGEKIEQKLHVPVHVESQSDLEEKFAEWGLEMPPDTHGFVHDGEIYINKSNASQSDLFHEYTHIMLAVLKAKNYDNYYQLITSFGEKLSQGLVNAMINKYPNMARTDIYEELFAELFGKYLAGNDMDKFLANELSIQKKVIDEKLGSIFGKEALTEEFYNSSIYEVFKQFSFDLGVQMLEDNGMHLKLAHSYAEASNWILEQIKEANKEHFDEDGNAINVGIYETCD